MTDYTKIEAYGPLRLRQGKGGSWDNGLCVMETVHWLSGAKDAGETPTDKPECACPVLGALAIRLNDYLDDENRQKLLPLALPLTGTRSPEHEKLRAEFLVMAVINRILPQAFEKKWPEHARAMREAKTLEAARMVCVDAKRDARVADDAVYAAAASAAAASAYASRAAVYAAVYASRAAVYASRAAADDAATARQSILVQCIPILKEAIELGPNAGDQWPEFKSRARELGEYVGASS